MRRTRANPSPGGFQALPMEAPKRRITKRQASSALEQSSNKRQQRTATQVSVSSREPSEDHTQTDTSRTSAPSSPEIFSREVSEERHIAEGKNQANKQAEIELSVEQERYSEGPRENSSTLPLIKPPGLDQAARITILTRKSLLETFKAIANHYQNNPEAEVVPTAEVIAFLQGSQKSPTNQGTQTTPKAARTTPAKNGLAIEESVISNQEVPADDRVPETPRGRSDQDSDTDSNSALSNNQETVPQTPSSARSWAAALNPLHLIRTPLNFFARRARNAPATDVRRSRPQQPSTEAQQQSPVQAPATISHPFTRPAMDDQDNTSFAYKPTRLDSYRRAASYKPPTTSPHYTVLAQGQSQSDVEAAIGVPRGSLHVLRARTDTSHLPLQLRGCEYEDLPDHWKARSQHMRREPEKASAKPTSSASKRASSSSSRTNRTSRTPKTSRPITTSHEVQSASTSSSQPLEKQSASSSRNHPQWKEDVHKEKAHAQYLRDQSIDAEDYEQEAGHGNKRKRAITIIVKKVYKGKISDSTYGMPDNIYDTDSDEEVVVDIETSDEEADESVLLDPKSPSNRRILKTRKNFQGKSKAASPRQSPEKSSTGSFKFPDETLSDDDESESEASPTPTNGNFGVRQRSNDGTYYVSDDFDVVDEPEWDISENDPRMERSLTLKHQHPWLAAITDIKYHSRNDPDKGAAKLAAYKTWWKAKMRYEKHHRDVAMDEAVDLGVDSWIAPTLVFKDALQFKGKNSRLSWPTPLPQPFEELYPFDIEPPRVRQASTPQRSVVLEQTQRQLTPEEFGDPHRARPYTGNMFTNPPVNTNTALTERVTELERNQENIFLRDKDPQYKKARNDALKYKPKLPSNLSHAEAMSPLQPVATNTITADNRVTYAEVTDDDEVLKAILAIPADEFDFDFPFPKVVRDDGMSDIEWTIATYLTED